MIFQNKEITKYFKATCFGAHVRLGASFGLYLEKTASAFWYRALSFAAKSSHFCNHIQSLINHYRRGSDTECTSTGRTTREGGKGTFLSLTDMLRQMRPASFATSGTDIPALNQPASPSRSHAQCLSALSARAMQLLPALKERETSEKAGFTLAMLGLWY